MTTDWQDISTAPKDGTWVLVAGGAGTGGWMAVMCWERLDPNHSGCWCGVALGL